MWVICERETIWEVLAGDARVLGRAARRAARAGLSRLRRGSDGSVVAGAPGGDARPAGSGRRGSDGVGLVAALLGAQGFQALKVGRSRRRDRVDCGLLSSPYPC